MVPFSPMRNVDGLSNKYTDNLYQYAPRPTCSAGQPECGSRFLFCDFTHGAPKCVSRLKPGSQCTGYARGENPCYMGQCQGGRCVAGAPIVAPQPTPMVTTAPVVMATQETCYNEDECCGPWAANGECTRNAAYMTEWCKASCGHCHPQYRLADDCSDRHPNCASWTQQGECTRNAKWMGENCRKSCNRCGQTRAAACAAGGRATQQAQQSNQIVCENSDGCYNENVCCPHWALYGECRKSSAWMACNCRVSCGHCYPEDYVYGSCSDYHRECAGWARLGECEKNPWMSENCRASCRTCYSQWDLRDMCRGAVGSVAPVAQRRPQQQPTRVQFDPFGGFGGFDDRWGMGWGDGLGGGRRGGRGRGGWGGPPQTFGGWGWQRAKRNRFPRK
ncbi:unnamed protein product [Cylicostephanus goldi]|uniref:ShKT domain-containing protein n=1 Tax=Cylicostephanus goldi TaxID=71465 RepID=A0A3P6Q806_CYLGO|nr:unnamed protein product [Cylicostephanus goldi]